MYIGQQLHPEALLYDSVRAIELSGVDTAAFRRAFQTVLNSCDALRTVIEEREMLPSQRVRPPFRYTVW